jgi:hypothetical protein
MMEPDNVNQTPSYDFAVAAAGGDIRNGPSGLDDHRQELLAERGQAKRANRNSWFSRQFCIRVRRTSVKFAARGEYERRWIRMALSGWPEISGDARQRQVIPRCPLAKLHTHLVELSMYNNAIKIALMLLVLASPTASFARASGLETPITNSTAVEPNAARGAAISTADSAMLDPSGIGNASRVVAPPPPHISVPTIPQFK